MKKVAIIFNGDLNDRKGYTNAVLERAKALIARKEFSVDIFCLSQYDYCLVRLLRHTQRIDRPSVVEIDGMQINILWYPFSLLDYLLSAKFHISKIVEPMILKQLSSKLRGYDLISAHSFVPAMLALCIHKQYKTPYCVTWHGSDIHTEPFKNRSVYNASCELMHQASCNMFVSRALQRISKQIAPNTEGEVLYNAASSIFCRLAEKERNSLRNRYQSTEYKRIVAFAGGLVQVKNADLLPDIFNAIQQQHKEKIEFWVIGDGKLRTVIEGKLSQMPGVYCKLWGNQPVGEMPLLLNCTDVLVLPSKNEGLPLIVVEALQCGSNVVASDVGGIKEVLKEGNTVALGEDFVFRFATRVAEILNSSEPHPAPSEQFNWQVTSKAESLVYQKILKIKI